MLPFVTAVGSTRRGSWIQIMTERFDFPYRVRLAETNPKTSWIIQRAPLCFLQFGLLNNMTLRRWQRRKHLRTWARGIHCFLLASANLMRMLENTGVTMLAFNLPGSRINSSLFWWLHRRRWTWPLHWAELKSPWHPKTVRLIRGFIGILGIGLGRWKLEKARVVLFLSRATCKKVELKRRQKRKRSKCKKLSWPDLRILRSQAEGQTEDRTERCNWTEKHRSRRELVHKQTKVGSADQQDGWWKAKKV